jgi:hypothetical protein
MTAECKGLIPKCCLQLKVDTVQLYLVVLEVYRRRCLQRDFTSEFHGSSTLSYMISGKQTFFLCDLTQTSNHMKITSLPIKPKGSVVHKGCLCAVCGVRWNQLRHFSLLEAATGSVLPVLALFWRDLLPPSYGTRLFYCGGFNLNINSYDD